MRLGNWIGDCYSLALCLHDISSRAITVVLGTQNFFDDTRFEIGTAGNRSRISALRWCRWLLPLVLASTIRVPREYETEQTFAANVVMGYDEADVVASDELRRCRGIDKQHSISVPSHDIAARVVAVVFGRQHLLHACGLGFERGIRILRFGRRVLVDSRLLRAAKERQKNA